MHRSLRWARRGRDRFVAIKEGEANGIRVTNPGQSQFGIIQGGVHKDLRSESAAATVEIGFEAYAIGGLSVGEPVDVMYDVVGHTAPLLPADRPRYLMGTGMPDDLIECVALGMDMFDCVLPTRAGRHGTAYTRHGRLNLKNARHADDPAPLEAESKAIAANAYSRAYLHHLVRSGEILGMMLLTWANLAYYQDLMTGLRKAIADGRLETFVGETREAWARAERDGETEGMAAADAPGDAQ